MCARNAQAKLAADWVLDLRFWKSLIWTNGGGPQMDHLMLIESDQKFNGREALIETLTEALT